jgi:hypothetical protein
MEQAARGMTDSEDDMEAVSRALEALGLVWGDLYVFGHEEQLYWAARPDRPDAERLRAETPEKLGELCAADSEAETS